MKKFTSLLILLSFLAQVAHTQNIAINAAGTAPNASAMLDVASTNSGLLVPRMTIAQRNAIANPATSLLIFQTNTNPGYYYNAGTPAAPNWVRLFEGEGWSLTGNAGTVPNNNFVGTTDDNVLRFRTNNIQRFEISTGNETTGGHLRAFNNGTAAAPTYSFNANTGIGMFRAGTNILGFSTAGTERMRITATGFFGIRNNAPTSMLHMTNGGVAVGAAAMAAFNNTGTTGVALSGYNQSASNAYNGVEAVTAYSGEANVAGILGLHIYGGAFNSAGVGVRGQSNDWQGIGVLGARVNNGGADAGWGGLFLGDLGYTGLVLNASDAKVKTNIVDVENSLSLLSEIRIVEYSYDTLQYPHLGLNTEREYGVIAQELKEVLPTMVKTKSLPININQHTNPNQSMDEVVSEDFEMVDYTKLIPLLVKGIQEQQETIQQYEEIINDLLERIEVIESQLTTD